MHFKFLSRVALCFSLTLGSLHAAEPTLSDVLRSAPKPANAVMHLDLVALRKLTFGTPMEMDLPSRLSKMRIASEIDLSRLQPNWEIGYGTMQQIPSPEAVAKAMGGYVETIADRQVVWTPHQMYLVPLPDSVLSIVRPADRKFLAQWLRRIRNPNDSEILLNAAATPTDNLSVMMAVDLQDVISANSIAVHLDNFQSVKGKNIRTIAKEISDLRGVKLEVALDSLSNSQVTLMFRDNPTELTPIAKEFFGEIVQRRGTSLGDLSSWKLTADTSSKSLVFAGPIVPATLDDLLGIFTAQRQTAAIEHSEKQPDTGAQPASQSTIAENTREYFQKVINVVRRVRNYSASNTGERAQWNGNMAGRIDDLPTLNIDPDMVQFGAEVARTLRNNMVSMQLTNIATGAQAVASNAGAGGFSTATGFGTAAGFLSGAGFSDPNSISTFYMTGQAQGNSSFRQMMAHIDQAIADMRRTMTNKYGIQF